MSKATIPIIAIALWILEISLLASLIIFPQRAKVTLEDLEHQLLLQVQFWKALLRIFWRETLIMIFLPFTMYLMYYIIKI